MMSPQVVVPAGTKFDEIGSIHYGLGFLISTYRGHRNVFHGGKCVGFSALISLLPDTRAGVVVLSNVDASRLPHVVAYRALDELLGLDPIPWGERYRDFRKAKGAEKGAIHVASRKESATTSHAIDQYVGVFAHPAYGEIAIGVPDPQASGYPLTMTYHEFTSGLNHFHHDVFNTPPDPLNRLERLTVKFETGPRGGIDRVLVPFEPRVVDIVFERV